MHARDLPVDPYRLERIGNALLAAYDEQMQIEQCRHMVQRTVSVTATHVLIDSTLENGEHYAISVDRIFHGE